MKKIISILLTLLLLTACGGQPTSPPTTQSSQVTQPEATSSQAEPPESTPVVPSVVMSSLTTPIHIVLESDNAEAYKSVVMDNTAGNREPFLVTEKEVAEYTAWANSLDGKDITAIYAEAVPVLEYKQGDISLAESQIIFDKLKAATPHIKTMTAEERMNPYTGGGWTLAIHTGEDITTIFFNGGWLVVGFTGQSDYWAFNVSGTPAASLCSEINKIIFDNMGIDTATPTT